MDTKDFAGLVSPVQAARLESKLREFEKQTSNQILVAVYPKLPSPSLEDFTIRTAESWRAGRKELDNGVVFFVFAGDRKMRIETGYGLEGALPDQLAARILDNEVRPRFRAGDWAGGLEAGIDGIIAATRGEYTAPPPPKPKGIPLSALLIVLVFVILFFWPPAHSSPGAQVGRTYGRGGAQRHSGRWGGGSLRACFPNIQSSLHKSGPIERCDGFISLLIRGHSTKPNPFGRPVMLSIINLTDSISPNFSNNSRTSS